MEKQEYEIVNQKLEEKEQSLSDTLSEYHVSPEFATALEKFSESVRLPEIQASLNISTGIANAISSLSEASLLTAKSVALDMGQIISSSLKNNVAELAISIHESMGCMLKEMINSIHIDVPKIKFPTTNNETRRSWKLMRIISEVNFPIYFEMDKELQDRILDICDRHIKTDDKKYPVEEIKECIYDYYDTDVLAIILNTWIDQEWINPGRKAALREAIDVYEEGRYYSTGSILMCQLGGLITELYDYTHTRQLIPLKEKKEMLSMYNIKNIDSEKSKVLQMIYMQPDGVYTWYNSADYLMNYVYSSSNNMDNFENNPGRNKICHGQQTNYGTREHALKSILVVDIIVQLGMHMLNEMEQAS